MKVKLKNVGVIDSCNVEFVPGINLIVGSSGSGKSTLLRSIHNIAVNEFSDSDISFGKESMSISVVCDDNVIEYERFIKPKGDKFYYIVNGEKYSKVGRQSLSAANDILKLGDIDINGDSINFNFNMQFSTPFLIFGSQSTLYNVLTYRSQFDISKINDCYNVDVKSNNGEINTSMKVLEQLNNNLSSLKSQEEKLRSIEEIYSDYMSYKHELQKLSELNTLLTKLENVGKDDSYVKGISDLLHEIDETMASFEKLNDLITYERHINEATKLDKFISDTSAIESNYRCAESLTETLTNISLLNHKIELHDKESRVLCDIDDVLSKSSIMIAKDKLIVDVIDCYNKLISKEHFDKATSLLERLNDVNIDALDGAILVYKSMEMANNVSDDIANVSKLICGIDEELSSFNVCPLCGSCLQQEHV